MVALLQSVTLEHEEIVIGCSLESLIYCYFTATPFLYCKRIIPHEFDLLNKTEELSPFRLAYEPQTIHSISGSKQKRPPKAMIWDRLFFLLNMKGLSVMPNECASIRIEDNSLKAFTPNARMSKINFGKLVIFDDYKVMGLPPALKNNNMVFKVFDWINIRNSTTHPIDYIETKDDLVNEIIFYPSRRSAMEIVRLKDIITVSTIKEADIEDYEWSDVAVKFKTLFLMKEADIRGAKNGKDMLDKTKTKHYALKIETVKRDVIPLNRLNIYSATERFLFNEKTYDELLKEFEDVRSPFDSFARDLQYA